MPSLGIFQLKAFPAVVRAGIIRQALFESTTLLTLKVERGGRCQGGTPPKLGEARSPQNGAW